MANFRLQINSLARSTGRRATAAAAYRAGERIRDEQSGEVHNYSQRRDVLHAEIFLPSQLTAEEAGWARDRSSLWNAAQRAETRRTARLAREFQVTLPFELTGPQRLELARNFSQEVANRYGVAVDLAIHEPRPGSDPRNFHAHLLATTRSVTAKGLGAKAGIDLPQKERQRLNLPSASQEYTAIRERWATLTNEALKEANIDARVDHRSLREQGIDREPHVRIPTAALKIDRAGQHSGVAERMRAEQAGKEQARREGTAKASEADSPSDAASANAPKRLDVIRQEAAEAWLRLRSEQARSQALDKRQTAVAEPALEKGKGAQAAPFLERPGVGPAQGPDKKPDVAAVPAERTRDHDLSH